MSIASTPYRLADAAVLIGVLQTPQGPQPLFTEIDGHSTVVAYTDVEQARVDYPHPLLVLALDDVPVEHREWLLA